MTLPSEERLELVTDFGSLRSGMLVVVKPCGCGRTHRVMLLGWDDSPSSTLTRGVVEERTFKVSPQPSCSYGGGSVVGPTLVAERRLYRVVDGIDLAADEGAALADEMCARVRANRLWVRP